MHPINLSDLEKRFGSLQPKRLEQHCQDVEGKNSYGDNH